MSKINREIGQLVRKHRESNGITQLELSKALGYESAQFVSLFERGISKVPLHTLGKIIVVLNIPQKKLFEILMGDFRSHVMGELNSGKSSIKAGG